MAQTDAGADVLRRAESEIQALLEAAVREQRYAEVATLAAWAQGLAALLRQSGGTATTPQGGTRRQMASLRAPAAEPVRADPPVATPRAAPRKATYPRFERSGDRLVKIGWSKKGREEYEHRAPKQALIAVMRHLSETTSPGKVFAVEDVTPVSDRADGNQEIPLYQVYLAIAWLRSAGLLHRRGRDGYEITKRGLEESGIHEIWEQLPERRA